MSKKQNTNEKPYFGPLVERPGEPAAIDKIELHTFLTHTQRSRSYQGRAPRRSATRDGFQVTWYLTVLVISSSTGLGELDYEWIHGPRPAGSRCGHGGDPSQSHLWGSQLEGVR